MTTTFSIVELDSAKREIMQKKGIWKPEAPVSLDRLRCLSFPYYDFRGKIHIGELIIMDVLAPYMSVFFEKLYELHFPINKVSPMENYDGDDDASMRDNNTSGFNCRVIAGTEDFSLHAYGLALDFNPLQNPYIGNSHVNEEKDCGLLEVWPTEGVDYINRGHLSPGMVEPIVNLIHSCGLRDWGGNWIYNLDYHHFQTPRSIAELLVAMTPSHAIAFFDWYVKTGGDPSDGEESFKIRYEKDPEDFMKQFRI